MSNQWLRLWHDMPTDPKWRTIAKASGQRIGDVMAVYLHVLVAASTASERGRTQSFNCEDVASALDLETGDVAAIFDAMQSRVIEGDMVRGWEKRQPAREDGSAERGAAWRAEQKAKKVAENAPQTNANADERNQTLEKNKRREEETKKEKKTSSSRGSRRCPADFVVTDEMRSELSAECPGVDIDFQTSKLRDWEFAKTHNDWPATWRNWIREAFDRMAQRSAPMGRPPPESFRERDLRAATERVAAFTGRPIPQPRDNREIFDVEAHDVTPRQLG